MDAYPAGYHDVANEYAKRMRKLLRTGGHPLTEVGRLLGVAWSERYPMPERAEALAKAKALLS